MIERRDALFTLIQDRDLHDHAFYCAHYTGNDHIDLTTPIDRRDHRTLHLGAHQALQWGRRIERLGIDIITADPGLPGNYEI